MYLMRWTGRTFVSVLPVAVVMAFCLVTAGTVRADGGTGPRLENLYYSGLCITDLGSGAPVSMTPCQYDSSSRTVASQQWTPVADPPDNNQWLFRSGLGNCLAHNNVGGQVVGGGCTNYYGIGWFTDGTTMRPSFCAVWHNSFPCVDGMTLAPQGGQFMGVTVDSPGQWSDPAMVEWAGIGG
ncbi:hypothetical protein [Nocardia sp. NPDC020380]|uniref:hypothetical protein n=1 Tax=Nocardia sp. NPDC020380 TaxID=3364309 RepID=UPI0037BBB7E3